MKELGNLETSVLVAVLEARGEGFALEIRRSLRSSGGRSISRGAFYTTVERLNRKGFVEWDLRIPPDSRRALAQRRYRITPAGLMALRAERTRVADLWRHLSEATGE